MKTWQIKLDGQTRNWMENYRNASLYSVYTIVKLVIDNINRKKDSPVNWTKKCEIMRIDYGSFFGLFSALSVSATRTQSFSLCM